LFQDGVAKIPFTERMSGTVRAGNSPESWSFSFFF
jgi:hypothetical protein